MIGRLNLGGAGQGMNRAAGLGDVAQSTSGLNLGKEGGLGSFRPQFGVDKSMDNLNLGFRSKFGLGEAKAGATSAVSQRDEMHGVS